MRKHSVQHDSGGRKHRIGEGHIQTGYPADPPH